MVSILAVLHAHPYAAGWFAFWLFSNAVDALPTPAANSGNGYKWFYKFITGFAGNLFSALSSKFGSSPVAGSNTSGTSTSSIASK